jgi:hypothetical protein
MLKELNQRWQRAQRAAGAWRRWNRKLPHNRVRRQPVRDAENRKIGYGPPTPIPEPEIDVRFCRRTTLPSGRVELQFLDFPIEAAYRLARRPMPAADQVTALPMEEQEIRRLYAQCREEK